MGIFKAYDIRGIYGKDLTEKEAYLIGYYIAKLLNLKEFKVSHDFRVSHEMLTKFFIQGLIDANCEVIYLGLSSTPNFYFSLFEGVNSGVQITASHNPCEYNGFKFMIDLKSFDARNGLKDLEKLVFEDLDNKSLSFDLIFESLKVLSLKDFLIERHIEINNSTLDSYCSFLTEFYLRIISDEEKKVLKSLNLGFDFAGGMSSLGIVKFLNNVGIKAKLFNSNLDPMFSAHLPEPKYGIETLNKISSTFDLFFAFDGDGDRIGIFNEKKEFVLMDYVIATFIDYFSKNSGSKKFVCDLRASRVITDIATEKNLDLKLLRVGRSFYQDYLLEHNCKFGGELSGHLFFHDFHNLDNPDIALIYLFKIIAGEILEINKSGNVYGSEFKLSKFISKYEKYCRISETNLDVRDANKVFEVLENKFNNKIVSRIDGLSFDFGSYWFNVRKSNTEPIIRINFEGSDDVVTKKEFDNLIKMIKEI